jgi:hypothetical protein
MGVLGRAQKYSGVPRVFRPKPVRAELLDGPVKMTSFRPLGSQNRFVFSVHKITVGELHDWLSGHLNQKPDNDASKPTIAQGAAPSIKLLRVLSAVSGAQTLSSYFNARKDLVNLKRSSITNYYHNTTTFLMRPLSFINVLINTFLLYIFPRSPLPQECRLSILPTLSIPPLAVIKVIYSYAIPKPLQDTVAPLQKNTSPQYP